MAVYERTICLSCEDTAEVDRIMHRKTVSERDCDYDKSFTAEFEGDIIGCVSIIPPVEYTAGARPFSSFILWRGEDDIDGLEPVIDDEFFGVHRICWEGDEYCLNVVPAEETAGK